MHFSATKAAQLGLAASLQFEAMKLKMDIKINTLIPQADTRMTRDFGTQVSARKEAKQSGQTIAVELDSTKDNGPQKDGPLSRMAPGNVSAMVVWLCHQSCDAEATVHEAGAGCKIPQPRSPANLCAAGRR